MTDHTFNILTIIRVNDSKLSRTNKHIAEISSTLQAAHIRILELIDPAFFDFSPTIDIMRDLFKLIDFVIIAFEGFEVFLKVEAPPLFVSPPPDSSALCEIVKNLRFRPMRGSD